MSQTSVIPFLYGKGRNIFSKELDLSIFDLSQSCDGLNKLCLTITIYTCNTDNLAFSYGKGEVFYSQDAFIVKDIEVFNLQNSISWSLGRLFDFERYRTTYHHGGHIVDRSFCYIHNIDELTSSDDGTSICNLFDFIQLMGDENNALPFSGKILHDRHKLFYFLWGKNSSRFIENEDICIPIEHLQYFDSLLHSHCNVFDNHIRLDLKTVASGYFFYFLGC